MRVSATLAALLFALGGPCVAHEVGDKTVGEVFREPALRSLAEAACAGDTATIVSLVSAGADANGRGLDEVTPLLWSISCQNRTGVKALLEAGADPNLGAHRFMPVAVAATYDDPAVLAELLDHGATIDVVTGIDTALTKAFATGVHRNDWRSYDLLLQRGANIELADSSGETIAHYAVAMGRFDKLVELLERGYSRDLAMIRRSAEARAIGASFPEMQAMKERALQVIDARLAKAPD